MYDLAKDPSETNNLNKKQPEEFKSLLEGWEKINGNMVEPLFK
jgi:hypothetical protein